MSKPTSRFIVTLDGPAASGKSSVAQRVAVALAIPYVSSGLLYRTATLLTLEQRGDPDSERALLALLAQHEVTLEARVDSPNRVWLDGHDVSDKLHTDEVDRSVSAVARHPAVRRWVYWRLREVRGPFVIEGRDMGRVVFPDAPLKVYLTASPEVRAARRVGERAADLGEVAEALRRRDALDATQLEPASDAVHIDSSALSLEEVVQAVLAQVEAQVEAGVGPGQGV